MNNIGENKMVKRTKLLTREEFADILLVNPSTIRKWEKGKNDTKRVKYNKNM